MSIRSVTWSATVPAKDSLEATVLTVAARLVDCPMTITIGETTSVTVQTVNTLTATHVVDTGVGLAGACLLLWKGTEYAAAASAAAYAQQTSWMHAVTQTALPIVKNDRKEALFSSQIETMAMQLETHLLKGHLTWLVGDTLTGTDVYCAILLAAACDGCNVQVPQQAFRWMQTVLHSVAAAVGDKKLSAPLLKWAKSVKEGAASPASLPAAVAAVAAAPAPAAKPAAKPAAPAPAPKPAPAPTPTPTPAAPAATPVASSSSSGGDAAIVKLLTDFGLEHEVYSHTACMTADELQANVPIPETDSHTKNLFLRDKKHGLFLVTVRPSAAVQTKELAKLLNLAGKTNLRMADESVLDSVLHVKPGCVGPLALGLADLQSDPKVTLVLDQALLDCGHVHSHPATNDQSVKLKPSALQAYLAKLGVEPVLLEFAEAGAAPAPAAEKPKPPAAAAAPAAAADAPKKKAPNKQDKKTAKKGETLLALQWKKDENFAMWYTDVIVLSEMISYYDISGCYILRPWSYKMWELIQVWFNAKIQALGVENSYFPLFVSQDRLEKEKDHVEGFAPEVAWVTKSGSGDLAKPIAVRPTSETIMYPAYSDWIKSHRDLPLKLNQWSNVVRWEFKYPTPFLRSREFLWQEGHTAHATYEDADEMVMQALELYRGVYEDLLAVPVIKGYKTEKEKFAGGFRTTTVEAYVAGSGRAIQGATSHNLGQNFGKMFDITFQDVKGAQQTVWQTSWGLTTRTIGVMVMTHGDDIGLVLPPAVAPIQAVIVPIISKKLTQEDADPYCLAILEQLQAVGIRTKYDDRTLYNPGWKYNHWEQKGVPVRLEVGPRDIEQKSVRVVVRHDGSKQDLNTDDLVATMVSMLDTIQKSMFATAKAARDSHLVQVTDWKDFVPNLEKHNLVLTPWCGGEYQDWEEHVKDKSRQEALERAGETAEDERTATSVAAKTLCIPFDQPELPAGTKCLISGMDATCWVLWGRSY